MWQCRECSSADITVDTVHIDFPYEVTTKTVEESLDTPLSIEEEIQTHRDELESPGSEVSPGVSPVFSMYDAVKFGRNRFVKFYLQFFVKFYPRSFVYRPLFHSDQSKQRISDGIKEK